MAQAAHPENDNLIVKAVREPLQLTPVHCITLRTGHALHRVHRVAIALSGVHSIMVEKLAQAVDGGGCTPTLYNYIYYHVQSCDVRSSWEGRYTPSISSLPLYVLCAPPAPSLPSQVLSENNIG